MAVTDNVFIRIPLVKQSCNCQQSKKPSSGLVCRFNNKISRKLFFEHFSILKRPMPLSVWHSSGIKPDVNQIRYFCHLSSTLFAFQNYFINIRPVHVQLPIIIIWPILQVQFFKFAFAWKHFISHKTCIFTWQSKGKVFQKKNGVPMTDDKYFFAFMFRINIQKKGCHPFFKFLPAFSTAGLHFPIPPSKFYSANMFCSSFTHLTMLKFHYSVVQINFHSQFFGYNVRSFFSPKKW